MHSTNTIVAVSLIGSAICNAGWSILCVIWRSLLFATFALEARQELAILVHSHATGAALSALATLWGCRGSGGHGLLASSGGLSTCLLYTCGGNKSIDRGDSLCGSLCSGLLGGSLLSTSSFRGSGCLFLGRFTTTEGFNLGVTFFELPLTTGVGEDTLGDDVLSSNNRSHLNLFAGSGGKNLLVTESLDGGLELIVSVEVSRVAGGMERFLKLGLKGMDDEAALNTGVRSEDLGGVNFAELKSPFSDNNNLAFELFNVYSGEFALIFGEGGLGEVGGNVEEGIRHEEVMLGLLDEDLQVFPEEVLG